VAGPTPPARPARLVLGISFIGFGRWTLVPDTADEPGQRPGWGPLVSTTVIFFLAEMGDKTQLATIALGARFTSTVLVTAGTTLGMLAADGLAVVHGVPELPGSVGVGLGCAVLAVLVDGARWHRAAGTDQ